MLENSYYRGAYYKVISSLAFAVVNGLVRFVSKDLPYAEIAFLQNVFGSFMIFWLWSSHKEVIINKNMLLLKGGYVFFAVVGLVFWYGALSYLPIATCVALGFLGPVFTVLGSRIFLKEELNPLRVLAILVGILGALLITRPDHILFSPELAHQAQYLILPLLSTLCWVFSKLFSRVLAKNGEPSANMTFYLLMFMAPVSFIPALPVFVMPSIMQILLVLLISIFTVTAHYYMNKSYSLADVSYLMPFGFVRLLASGLIGFFAFHEVPKGADSIFGMLAVLISLAILAMDERKIRTELVTAR